MGNIAGTLFRSSTDLIVGTAFDTLISSPTEYLVRLQNAVIPGVPALGMRFQKEGTTAWNWCGNRDWNGNGNHSGNHDRNHGVSTRIPKSGTGWGMGVAGGRGREMEIVQRGFPGGK